MGLADTPLQQHVPTCEPRSTARKLCNEFNLSTPIAVKDLVASNQGWRSPDTPQSAHNWT